MDIKTFQERLKPNTVIRGALFREPVQVSTTILMGQALKVLGKGLTTEKFYDPILTLEDLQTLEILPTERSFDGDPVRFRLGIEAKRLELAYEYDPFFILSIARVDPLPHQLEAVYDYFLKQPRIRFLLADDPGAGKTIMAGLLIKELKIRGLIRRILILTPAKLSFQWQRELKDKFRETFEIIRGDVLRSNYGVNPWQERQQVITSVSWVDRVEDAKESLLRSHWDLIVVDEAHKMSASSTEKKNLAYQLGEELSKLTDHYLLMTATPHKGDPENFRLFLALLDKDVYGDVKSLEEAIRRHSAPFYLRRIKEAMLKFPDPATGRVEALFTRRIVQTAEFKIDDQEWEFYHALTQYVEDQSVKADPETAQGRALGFTMALLQRRFASSIYAVRRSLERMKEKRERILADPEGYRREQMLKKVPEDFEDLTEEEQQEILEQLEAVVATVDPDALQVEIIQLQRLIRQAQELEQREVETKLVKLRDVIEEHDLLRDPQMRLLIFTEHKDTLDYLVGKLRQWGLSVTQIHGSMKIGDRDTPGSRIYAEREFKESCQILVATEAAGEGINLQFCWFMINYDIPWNPVRLEQRMGRIHRYGQTADCLIINFVSINTSEGRVLQKLFDRIRAIEQDLDPQQTGKVFNVLGDLFPANKLEGMIRDMYARHLTEKVILDRIVEEVELERFKKITHSTLEGLARKELNLSSIVGRTAEAKEKRLVPEVIEDFFVQVAPLTGILVKETGKHTHVYRVGKTSRLVLECGDRLEPRFGKLGREYPKVIFDKQLLEQEPTLEWVTPGHPLFEGVRECLWEQVQNDLQQGAIFYDLYRAEPARLDVFSAEVRDGLGHTLHERLLVMQTALQGAMSVVSPTVFLDLVAAPSGTTLPTATLPERERLEQVLFEKSLQPLLAEVSRQRQKEIQTIEDHLQISLHAVIDRVQCQFADLLEQKEGGSKESGLEGRLVMLEHRLDELNLRLEKRRQELQQERHCSITNICHHGQAWVVPHPERQSPAWAGMVRDEDIERSAVQTAIEHERARGWDVVSVEQDNRGFDLLSRRPHPEDPQTALEVRFIEVKGRAAVGEIALTTNEYKTAQRLQGDYWLYVVYHCATSPELHLIQNPAQLQWQQIIKVEHYLIHKEKLLQAETEKLVL